MRDPLAQVRIRYKLPLTFLAICVVGFGVGGVVVTTQARSALQDQIGQRLDERAAAVHFIVERHLDLHKRRAEDFASDGFIRAELDRIVETTRAGDDATAREALERHLVLNKLPIVDAFVAAFVYDRDGRARAHAPREFAEAARGGRAAVTRVGPLEGGAQDGRQAAFRITTPLRHQREARPIGALQLVVALQSWVEGMSELAELPRVGDETLLLVGEGGLAFDLRTGASATPGTRRGDQFFEFQRGIAHTGWQIDVAVDKEAALAPAVRLRNRYLLVALLLLLLIAGVLFFPMRFLLQPLSVIAEGARRVAAGDFQARVDHDSGDEIGDLARSFNVMAEAVEERTGQLEEAAAALRRSEDNIRVERDRLAAVIHSMKDGLFILDPEGRVVLSNAAAAPILAALQPPDDCARRLDCRLETQPAFGCLVCLGTSEGKEQACVVEHEGRIHEIQTTVLPGGPGNSPSRLCVGRDVTERIASQETQAHQERMTVLGEVAAVMAHELNNPLAAISMFSQMLGQRLDDDSPLRENAEVIQRNVKHCKQTIGSLLDLAARGAVETEIFDLADLLEDVTRFLQPIYQRRGVSVSVEPCGGETSLLGDEVQLRQVFINLVMNAVQATGDNGHVVIRVRCDQESIEVRVEDDGPGIPSAVKARIFEPFFSTKGKGEGTGLGLPTSRRIVDEHGGALRLLGTGPEGTVFCVTLPRKTERHAWQAEARRHAPVAAARRTNGDAADGGAQA